VRRFIAGFCWIQIGWLVALTGCATSQPSRFVAWTIVGERVRVEGDTLVLEGGSVRTEKLFPAPSISFQCRLASGPADSACLAVFGVSEDGSKRLLSELKAATQSWAAVSTEANTPCRIELEASPASAVWAIKNFLVK
jgi:hypothetical protein